MNKQQKSERIIHEAFKLFSEQGFIETSMRQISQHAGISLGLINHYFGSKRRLGFLIIELLVLYAQTYVSKHLDVDEDPVLYDATLVRVTYTFVTSPPYKRFFLDCLEEDIFFDFLARRPNMLIRKETEKFGLLISDDILMLYGKFVPYYFEKTLSLNKEKGLFPSIGYDEIPEYIFLSGVERFLPKDALDKAMKESRKIAKVILAEMPSHISDEEVCEYAARASEKNSLADLPEVPFEN